MKQVWQTIDGHLFGDATDAATHEREIKARVRMWNGDGIPTEDVMDAVIVHLIGTNAGQLFINISTAQGAENYLGGIDEEASGWFFWDVGREEYIWWEDELVASIAAVIASENSAYE